MELFAVATAVALLVILIAWAKVHPFLAFVLAATTAALMLGMPINQIPGTVETGIGKMLGTLAIVICAGAMFGKLVADSGAAQKIAQSLIGLFGNRYITIAMAATGFIVGIPLFYNVGFVLLVPLVFSVMYQAKLPGAYVGIPLLAGLSIAHGFLPPHPSPMALLAQFNADIGLTLFYGCIVGVPTVLIAGPIFATTLKSINVKPAPIFVAEPRPDAELPSAFNAFGSALLPVALIAITTLIAYSPNVNPSWAPYLEFAKNGTVVMVFSLIIVTFTLGLGRGMKLGAVMGSYGAALKDISIILLIIAGAGALREVFEVSGVSAQLGDLLNGLPAPPLVLGWLIAAGIRVALGSATVAGLTAAGIVAPLVVTTGVDPNLMVLAVGAGSLIASHVNDSGFWMFKEYFNVSLTDTLRTWTVMETLVGVFGLIFVLLLDMVV